MHLTMDPSVASGYTSGLQVVRRVTEAWAADNLYCPACDAGSLQQAPTNTRAIDFRCETCSSSYQLKSSRLWSEKRIVDAGYDAMIEAIRSDQRPNLIVLQYSLDWRVTNMLLVPSFFFTASAIQKRKPLAPSARRAGWVGCYILLGAIPPEGKLRMVNQGAAVDRAKVRHQYSRCKPLSQLRADVRGWTLDVLRVVHSLGRTTFTIADVYAMESELAAMHPDNRNIRPKIRQRLQVLRDMGIVHFRGGGNYSLVQG